MLSRVRLALVAILVAALAGLGASFPAMATSVAEVETQPTSEILGHETSRDAAARAALPRGGSCASQPRRPRTKAVDCGGIGRHSEKRAEQTLCALQVRLQV